MFYNFFFKNYQEQLGSQNLCFSRAITGNLLNSSRAKQVAELFFINHRRSITEEDREHHTNKTTGSCKHSLVLRSGRVHLWLLASKLFSHHAAATRMNSGVWFGAHASPYSAGAGRPLHTFDGSAGGAFVCSVTSAGSSASASDSRHTLTDPSRLPLYTTNRRSQIGRAHV